MKATKLNEFAAKAATRDDKTAKGKPGKAEKAAAKKAMRQVSLDELAVGDDGQITIEEFQTPEAIAEAAQAAGAVEEWVEPVLCEDDDITTLMGEADKKEKGTASAVLCLFKAKQKIAAAESSGNPRAIQAATQLTAEGVAKANDYINKAFRLKGILLTGAAVGYVETAFTLPYETAAELKAMLKEMVARKLLVPDTSEDYQIRIGHNRFMFGDFGFLPQDLTKFTEKARQLSIDSDKLEFKRRRAKSQEISGQGNISLENALDGNTTGKCLVNVPTEFYLITVFDEQTSKPKLDPDTKKPLKKLWHRGGGHLLLEVAERVIYPIDASGSFEGKVKDIIARSGRFTRDSLALTPEELQAKKGNLIKAIQSATKCGYLEAKSKAEDSMSLWHMFYRARLAVEEEKARGEERRRMAAMAEIDPVAFLGLNGTSEEDTIGKPCFLQLEGVVREDKWVNPFILAQWVKDEGSGRKTFELLEISSGTTELLREFVGKQIPNINRASTKLGWLYSQIMGQTRVAHEASAE